MLSISLLYIYMYMCLLLGAVTRQLGTLPVVTQSVTSGIRRRSSFWCVKRVWTRRQRPVTPSWPRRPAPTCLSPPSPPSPTRSVTMLVQWNPSCEATPFCTSKVAFKEEWPLVRVEIITFMFRFTLSSDNSRGAGLSSRWPLKRCSTVYAYACLTLILKNSVFY